MDTFFDVPHIDQPMTAKEIIKKIPKFAKVFDGQCKENTLTFYYKKSKETGVYEFIDLEAEEEVAELMDVKIKEFTVKDEDDLDDDEKKPLDQKDIENFRTHMSDIRTGITWLKNQNKDTSENDSSDSDSSDSVSDSE